MKYSYEYKKQCVELYRQGKWPETPVGVKQKNFHKTIRKWARMEEACGPEVLHHKSQNKVWTAEEKYELVARVLVGVSNKEVAFTAGIDDGLLYQWVRCYKMKGYQGLVEQRKGRPPKEPDMKKKIVPAELTPSEREEMIRLRKEKYHSYKGDVGKVADNIINRNFSTEKPLQKWTTDVSQFNLSWGKCYISPILDMNTNEIMSYNLSTSPNMEQIKDMLNKAFEQFPSVQGLVMHSDQGWQYRHAFYRNELQKHGIIQSMSRKGNCYDNCIMETFFGRLKNEMFYGFEKDYPSFEAFSKAIAEYIVYYNNSRIQAKTKWMPPSKFREASMMEG